MFSWPQELQNRSTSCPQFWHIFSFRKWCLLIWYGFPWWIGNENPVQEMKNKLFCQALIQKEIHRRRPVDDIYLNVFLEADIYPYTEVDAVGIRTERVTVALLVHAGIARDILQYIVQRHDHKGKMFAYRLAVTAA